MNDICCLLFTAMFIYQNLKIALVIQTLLFLWFPSFRSELNWLTPLMVEKQSQKIVSVLVL